MRRPANRPRNGELRPYLTMKLIALLICLMCSWPDRTAGGGENDCSSPDAQKQVHLGHVQSDPAQLLRVRESRPEHYAKIQGVIGNLLGALVGFDARATEIQHGVQHLCTRQLMSHPPKILLELTIEEVRYQMILVRVAPPRPGN